jgi:hypothetical protein
MGCSMFRFVFAFFLWLIFSGASLADDKYGTCSFMVRDIAACTKLIESAFVKDVQVPGLEVRRLFDIVRDDVIDATHRMQQPFSYGSVSGRQDFYFVSK